MWSGRTRLALPIALLLGGCSQVFGLASPDRVPDGSVIQDNDTDGDGILDQADNCVDIKNPDQVDVDTDNIGDACQGCITLPFRASDDDDKDALNDLIDNCTGHPSVQPDTDGDGIGNACDARVGKDTRFCTWTFRPTVAGEDAAIWTSSWLLGSSFEIRDSQIQHQSSMTLDVATLRSATFDAAAGVAFDTRLHITSYTPPMVLGVGFELQTAVANLYTCQVVKAAAGSNPVLQLVGDGVVLDSLSVPTTLPLQVSTYVLVSAIRIMDGVRVNCAMDIDGIGGGSLMTTIPDQLIKLRPRLVADRVTVDFDHVSVYKLGI